MSNTAPRVSWDWGGPVNGALAVALQVGGDARTQRGARARRAVPTKAGPGTAEGARVYIASLRSRRTLDMHLGTGIVLWTARAAAEGDARPPGHLYEV